MEDKYQYKVLLPIVERVKTFLVNDMDISVSSDKIVIKESDKIILNQYSSLIGLNGSVEAIISMSYDVSLLHNCIKSFLGGDDPADNEIDELTGAVSSEFINIVVGNALINPIDHTTIGITPPMLVQKEIVLNKDDIDTSIFTSTIATKYGNLSVSIIEPKRVVIGLLNA